jgi:hypothetical protein
MIYSHIGLHVPVPLDHNEWHTLLGMLDVYSSLLIDTGYHKIERFQTEWESCHVEDLGMTDAPVVGQLVSQ